MDGAIILAPVDDYSMNGWDPSVNCQALQWWVSWSRHFLKPPPPIPSPPLLSQTPNPSPTHVYIFYTCFIYTCIYVKSRQTIRVLMKSELVNDSFLNVNRNNADFSIPHTQTSVYLHTHFSIPRHRLQYTNTDTSVYLQTDFSIPAHTLQYT